MTEKDTTMLDIYEAAGAKVSEDRTQVEMNTHNLQPFEIKLLVYPVGYEIGDLEKITFRVLLNPEVTFGETTYEVTSFHEHHFDEELTLPVKQVRILKKEQ